MTRREWLAVGAYVLLFAAYFAALFVVRMAPGLRWLLGVLLVGIFVVPLLVEGWRD